MTIMVLNLFARIKCTSAPFMQAFLTPVFINCLCGKDEKKPIANTNEYPGPQLKTQNFNPVKCD